MLLENKTLKPLIFVSVEGFWEKTVHDARVAEAAKKLREYPLAFAIATATYPPAQCTCFTDRPLGEYSAHKLIEKYGINPARIIPAYRLPQKTTYTIIDAYSNAMMIGWLCGNLSQNANTIHASLYPVSDGFRAQQERILLLNTRATDALKKLSIELTIHPAAETLTFEQISAIDQEEAQKLASLKKPGSLLYTGTWAGNSGITRSFDNIEAMKNEIAQAFGMPNNYGSLFELSDVTRLMLIMNWNIRTNTSKKDNSYFDKICTMIKDYFIDITPADIEAAKNELLTKQLL